ncbi:hypothetical protein V492_07612 [Pseudogymnoascus sp. VKM F-4246]|nr:hypothetical protein V492_07612 [Pseudogymnoascus sp. VKM F-4246]
MNGQYSDGGLYIVLSPLGGGHWHHALYIHVSHPYGMLYQLKLATPTTPPALSDHLIEHMPTSRTVSAALLIDPDVRDHRLAAAHSILIDTSIPALVNTSITTPDTDPADAASASSAWVVSALTRLGTAVLGLDEPVEPLMEQVSLLAAYAAANGSCEMRLSQALQARRKTAECEEVKRCWVHGCETCAMIRQRGCRDE